MAVESGLIEVSLRSVCDCLECEGIDRTASRRHAWRYEGNGPDISSTNLLIWSLLRSGMIGLEIIELSIFHLRRKVTVDH